MKVLVADDRGALAPTALVFLAWWGHEVEVARDGFEALRRARAWRPDLVLAPARLERMGGLSLLAALRAGGPPGVAVVIVAGEEDGIVPDRARALGALAVVAEPLTAPDLLRILQRAGREAALAAAS